MKFLTLAVALLTPLTALSVEVYSIFDNKCQNNSGYLIAEKDDIYTMLTTKGKTLKLSKNQIKGVLVYNFVNPPITSSKTLDKDYMRSLTVEDEGKTVTFKGYAIQFIEDLVVFLGDDGSTRVHKLDNIVKIRPTQSNLSTTSSKNKLDIKSIGYVQSCAQSGSNGTTIPNRILVDKIKIQQFLSNFKSGYEKLISFQERTYLYARPKIYTQNTRFGFLQQKATEQHSSKIKGLPFIEWSSGRPYRVQSLYQIGGVYDEFGADLDPILGFKTEVKAHFFHAIFTGNFDALAAGKIFFTKRQDLVDYGNNQPNDRLRNTTSDSTQNYTALVGGDYGPHSFSVALYYPIFIFADGDKVREALSTSNYYSFRYMHTTKHLRLYGVASYRKKQNESVSEDDLIAFDGANAITLPQAFDLNYGFLRLGADLSLQKQTFLGGSILLMKLDYFEGASKLKSDLLRIGANAYARKAFGDYVSFGIRGTYISDKIDSNFTGLNKNESWSKFNFGFEMALVF